LAVALLVRLKELSLQQPACALLFSPWADMTATADSYSRNAQRDPVLNREIMQFLAEQYLGERPRQTPLASPVFADLSGIAPLTIFAGSTEALLDDAIALKLDGKDSQTVVKALIKNARKLPQELYKSLTWDRGTEMHAHKQFTMATDIQVYFCDPQSPWQRGSNENTNGLLRQYMPKGMDLSGLSQLQLNAIARQLNGRPRKTLGFRTPAEKFSECVALTG
jgi:hypothetical protein